MSVAAVALVTKLISECTDSEKKGTNAPNLNSYSSAWEEDPELKSFGSSFVQRINKLKSSFAQGVKTECITLDVLKELSNSLVESSQSLANAIFTSKKDVLRNKELRNLVNLYFESTTKTLDLFVSVESRAKKAKLSHRILLYTMKQFKKESKVADFGGNLKKTKYAETLVELNKVKAMGDPFDKELMDQFKSVSDDQRMLLNKFEEMRVKLEEREDKLQKRNDLTNIILGAAALSFLALEICVCPVVLPLLTTKSATFAVGFGVNQVASTVGLLVKKMMADRLEEVSRQKNEAISMADKSSNNMRATATIKSLVDMLITSLTKVLGAAEFATAKREEEAIEDMMDEIIAEMNAFSDKLKELGEAIFESSKIVVSGKVEVLKRLNNLG